MTPTPTSTAPMSNAPASPNGGSDPEGQIREGVKAFQQSQDPAIAIEVVNMLAQMMGIAPEYDPYAQGQPEQPQPQAQEQAIPQGGNGMRFYAKGGKIQKMEVGGEITDPPKYYVDIDPTKSFSNAKDHNDYYNQMAIAKYKKDQDLRGAQFGDSKNGGALGPVDTNTALILGGGIPPFVKSTAKRVPVTRIYPSKNIGFSNKKTNQSGGYRYDDGPGLPAKDSTNKGMRGR